MMAVYTEQVATEFNFPNITIYRILKDGELSRYEVRPNDGYVMYKPNETNFDFNPETGESFPVTHYRTIAGFPKNYNFTNFPYQSELRKNAEERYIF